MLVYANPQRVRAHLHVSPYGKKRALSEGKSKADQRQDQKQSMSKYRASLSTGTRSGGQSASAKHKYHNRQEIYLVGREGVRDDLAASGSGNLPAFAQGDAGVFWLAADSFERKNARLFVELQLNLPAELTLEQQKTAVQSYMSEMCDKEKLAYSWVIHKGKNGENDHAHVMINEQKNDLINRPAEQHFMRWNSKYPERGGAQKSATLKPKQWLLDARGAWAVAANDGLEAAGFKRHFDHRTLKEQRVSALLAKDWRKAAELDREVCEHEGPRVAGLRRKYELGLIDHLPDYAKAVIESNNNIKKINAAHLLMVDGMTDQELQHWERAAYFDALAEREPERFSAELEQLHSEALELDAQDPEPDPPQASQPAADLFEDEDMSAFRERQLAAIAAMREAQKEQPFLRLVEPDERAPELEAPQAKAVEPEKPQAEAVEPESQLVQLREQLKAQDAQLEQLTEQMQEADRFAAEQAEKLSVREKEYQKSLQDQKNLEAQADAAEPQGFQALVAFVARAFGYQTESDKLRAQAAAKAGERFETMRAQLLAAKEQSDSAEKEAQEAKQDLTDGKAQRAALVDGVMLASGSGTLQKVVALEVQKLERLESDFAKLGSKKAFELKEQRQEITGKPEPTDADLLQQSKDLQKLAQGAGRDYRSERFDAAQQAQRDAKQSHEDAYSALKDGDKVFDDDYKKSAKAQLDADKAAYYELMKDPAKRGDPETFKALQSETQQLTDMLKQHAAERQQNAEQRDFERQQREAAPRQQSDKKSDFRL